MTSRKETSVSKKLEKVPFITSTRLTNRVPIMTEEQKLNPSISTQSNETEGSPQTSQSNGDRSPLNEQRTYNNFRLPALWRHNALVEAKFRMSSITTQIGKYMAVLEALGNSELEHLYNIPKSEDENCYEKLITPIRDVFTRDDRDRLDLLLYNLTLGDKTPNELMRHLISAAGVGEDCSPQFDAILKDRFLRCLPPDIAASSGTWSYTDLRSLAKCATQAMTATQGYGKPSSVLAIGNKSKNNTASYSSKNPIQMKCGTTESIFTGITGGVIFPETMPTLVMLAATGIDQLDL